MVDIAIRFEREIFDKSTDKVRDVLLRHPGVAQR